MFPPDLEQRIIDHFSPVFAKATDGASRVASESVQEVLETSTPTGRIYKDRQTGQKRRASAPGEPPADPEGALADSWKEAPARREGDAHRGAAYSDSGIAGPLEFGDPPRAPRPHARPGLHRAADKLRSDLGQVLR